jgi:pyruvate dehydrogenase E1 component beta subunit
LIASMRDPDPVMFMEPKRIYRSAKGEVPEGAYTVPIGKAAVPREGTDVSVFAYGSMIPVCLEAAKHAETKGTSVEVVDLRTLVPLDIKAVLASAEKTGRAVVVYEAPRTCGYGAEISALIAEHAMLSMKAPIVRVTGFDTPFPYALEDLYMPNPDRVYRAVEQVMTY